VKKELIYWIGALYSFESPEGFPGEEHGGIRSISLEWA
jgi:hypothetical protein